MPKTAPATPDDLARLLHSDPPAQPEAEYLLIGNLLRDGSLLEVLQRLLADQLEQGRHECGLLPAQLCGEHPLRFPGQLPIVMALGTILVGLSIVLLTIAEIFRRRGIARSGGQDTGGFL